MNQAPYPFVLVGDNYHFISRGKTEIEKQVQFVPLGVPNLYHLGFGDVLPNGTVDDMVISNNGDIIKVFVTLIYIIKDFLQKYPQHKVFFTGSTQERTSLYQRILRMYHEQFGEEYSITALINNRKKQEELNFGDALNNDCIGFFVRKK